MQLKLHSTVVVPFIYVPAPPSLDKCSMLRWKIRKKTEKHKENLLADYECVFPDDTASVTWDLQCLKEKTHKKDANNNKRWSETD